MLLKAGTTSVSTYFTLRDTTTNQPKTGVTITGIGVGYTRAGAALTGTATLTALANAASAWAANYGFEVDATNAPGLYRIDWPDAAFAAGVGSVMLSVHATGVIPEHVKVELNAAVDAVAISSDTSTADNLELMVKTGGTGAKLTLTQLNVAAGGNDTAVVITGYGTGNGMTIASGAGATGTGLAVSSAATNGSGMTIVGKGTGDGLQIGSNNTLPNQVGNAVNFQSFTDGKSGIALRGCDGVGSFGGNGMTITGGVGTIGSGHGLSILGGAGSTINAGDGLRVLGGAITGAANAKNAGSAMRLIGGGTGSAGTSVAAGSGIIITAPTTGGTTPVGSPAISATGTLAQPGMLLTGGASGDGMKLVGLGSGQYDLNVATKGIGGNLSGSVDSLTGYVAPANSDITAIRAKTDLLPATPASQADVTGVSAALLAAALSQSPTAGTVGEALVAALANAKNKLAITGTTMTLYKADGTTPLYAWTLNSPTEPTSRIPS